MPSNKFFQSVERSSLLTSYNFARNADFVYSEELTHEQYKNIRKDEHFIVHKDHRIVYIDTSIELLENNIIFSNTNYVKYLFNSLKDCEFKNIKLITHQTDIPINKKLFNQKPNCISEWYSINVDYEDESLIPIPLGLSNYYSPKNLFFEKYKKTNLDIDRKEEKIYVNFNVNTNRKLRQKLYDVLNKKDYCFIEDHSDNLEKYLNSLINYKFVICPEGNGIDTHRLWETIYAGSIPVVKKHKTLESAMNLPVIFVDDFNDINLKKIFENEFETTKINYEKLKIEYWVKKMKSNKVNNSNSFSKKEKLLTTKFNIFKYKLNLYINSYLKKLNYFLLRIKKLFNVVTKNNRIT